MGTTNFNHANFGDAWPGLAPAAGRSPADSASPGAESKETEANLSSPEGQTWRAEIVDATVTTAVERAAAFSGRQLSLRPRAPQHRTEEGGLIPRSCKAERTFSDGCPAEAPPRKRQTTGALPVTALPKGAVERIFSLIPLKDQKALSVTCRMFRTRFYAFYRPRCQSLLAADTKQLFTQFDINCPGGGAASPAHLEARVSRVHTILEDTTRLLPYFPGCSLPEHTAEELVLNAPPGELPKFLKTAYRLNLFSFFRSCVATMDACESFSEPYADEASLKEATRNIRGWLAAETGQEVTRFYVRYSDFMCVPSELGRLKNLQKLSLSIGCLRTIPPVLGQLTNLEVLTLSSNHLRTFPAELARLTNLTSLSLRDNRFCEVPATLWQLVQLEFLDLSANRLSEVSPKVCQLEKLRYFDLSKNLLSELPASVWQLEKLIQLNLSKNRLVTLSDRVGRLTSLRWLDLSKNQLSLLPGGIGQLVKLERLLLSDNELKTLPIEIGQLTALKWLLVDGNQLSGMPEEIIGPLRQAGTLMVGG